MLTTTTITGAGTETIDLDEDGTDPMLALGGRYHVNNNLSVRAEWEHFFGVSDDENSINLFSAGINITSEAFTSNTADIKPAPAGFRMRVTQQSACDRMAGQEAALWGILWFPSV